LNIFGIKINVEIFLNIQQQELALNELKQFEEKLYFESLLTDFSSTMFKYTSISK